MLVSCGQEAKETRDTLNIELIYGRPECQMREVAGVFSSSSHILNAMHKQFTLEASKAIWQGLVEVECWTRCILKVILPY